jgi:hypothetical protein
MTPESTVKPDPPAAAELAGILGPAALASSLPGEIRESLTGAARAIEGWPVRMPVRTPDDVAVVLALAEIKRST